MKDVYKITMWDRSIHKLYVFKWCLMVNVNALDEVLSLLGKGDEFWVSTILHILVDGEHWPRDP